MNRKMILLTVLVIFAAFGQIYAQESCYDCHGDPDFLTETEDGQERSLFVDQEHFSASVHADFACTDCHTDAFGDPHDENLNPVDCGMCHDDMQANYAQSVHGKLLAEGHKNTATCASCHTSHFILSESDERSSTHAFNLPATCGQCHYEKAEGDTTAFSIRHYLKGAHGKALAEGNDMAASCNDCHDAHKTLAKADPNSRIFGFNISKTCGECHEDAYNEFNASIHGQALTRGEFCAPTCFTCHGSHNIPSAADPASPTNRMKSAEQLCDPCHSQERLNQRFGININVVSSYMDSYHGLASRGGSQLAANCNDCHGIHNIRSKTDSLSTVHFSNVQSTCAKCHESVSETFSQSYTHASMMRPEDRLAGVIKHIYIWLIIVVIGGMILHNLLIWFYSVRLKAKEEKEEETIERFSKPAVLQHIALIISFTTLVITGFALKFPDSFWVKLLSQIGITEITRGIIHRIAAVMLIGTSVFHLAHVLFDRRFKGETARMTPRFQDMKEAIHNMAFYMGLSKTKPEFHKYSYIEKAEYWALVWGTVIMIITGFVLWFPTTATKGGPIWVVKVSEVVHFYEAILATLAILFYHMFFAIFHPEDYPLNLTGFTGRISKEEAKHRFPKWHQEYLEEEMKKQQVEKKSIENPSPDTEPKDS